MDSMQPNLSRFCSVVLYCTMDLVERDRSELCRPPLLLMAYLVLHIQGKALRAVPLQLHDDLGGV